MDVLRAEGKMPAAWLGEFHILHISGQILFPSYTHPISLTLVRLHRHDRWRGSMGGNRSRSLWTDARMPPGLFRLYSLDNWANKYYASKVPFLGDIYWQELAYHPWYPNKTYAIHRVDFMNLLLFINSSSSSVCSKTERQHKFTALSITEKRAGRAFLTHN